MTDHGALYKLQRHKTQSGKSKVKISIFIRKSYQRTDIENIWSRFYQVRPMVSHIEVCLLKKPPTPKNIGDALGGPQKNFWREALFVQCDKNKMLAFSQIPSQ